MSQLSEHRCEACRAGALRATPDEINEYLSQLPGWQINVVSGVNHLQKTYKFKDFEQALHFTNKIGAIAEQENHHPSILTEWGKVTVSWWTHKIEGLHINDFIMAAKTDAIS